MRKEKSGDRQECYSAKSFSVDIFACAQSPGDYSIIGEVKSREVKKFSKDEEDYCQQEGITCSEDERWLETGK